MSWIYFRRYPITRPAVGIFNRWDVAIMIGGIVLVPYVYQVALAWWVLEKTGSATAIGTVLICSL